MPPMSLGKSLQMVTNCNIRTFPSALSECGVFLAGLIDIQAQNLAQIKILLDI
jgi:hypothetical protein